VAFYVDKFPEEPHSKGPDHLHHCEPCFPSFPTLKAARKYAEKHGDPELGPLPVLDENGDTVPPRRTRKDMQADIDRVNEELTRQRQRVANIVQASKDADIARTQQLLQAGLIPLEEFRNRVERPSFQIEDHRDRMEYRLTYVVLPEDVTGADIINKIVNGVQA
jgi:hypothetical protein